MYNFFWGEAEREMHIEWIGLRCRYLQPRRLDGMFLGSCSATAGGDHRQVGSRWKYQKMIIIEAGHGLYKVCPAAPGEAQRDAFGMIRAHVDVAARAGHECPGSNHLGNRLRMGRNEQLDGVRACTVGIASCDVAYARVRVVQKWETRPWQMAAGDISIGGRCAGARTGQ